MTADKTPEPRCLRCNMVGESLKYQCIAGLFHEFGPTPPAEVLRAARALIGKDGENWSAETRAPMLGPPFTVAGAIYVAARGVREDGLPAMRAVLATLPPEGESSAAAAIGMLDRAILAWSRADGGRVCRLCNAAANRRHAARKAALCQATQS